MERSTPSSADPSGPAPDVVVVGDLMLDVSVASGALAPGGDVHGEVRLRPGGGGGNAAAWASHEGARTRMYGRVGDDVAGRVLREELRARGVEACLTVDPEVRTGSMLVVREGGDRSMVADRGANARCTPQDLPARLEAGAVLVSGYLLFHPDSEGAARAALERAVAPLVAVDAASWPLLEAYGRPRFLEATREANVLFLNEDEARVLWQAGTPPRLEDRFDQVWVKLGPRGASVTTGDATLQHPGFTVNAVADPTGAGDAFDGAVLAALARGESRQEALARGCRAGAAVAASPDTWPAP